MKKLLCFVFLAGSALVAAPPTTVLGTVGPWPLCEVPEMQGAFPCQGFEAGHERYLVLIHSTTPGAVAFRYTVTGTLLSTGQPMTVTAVIERADNSAGYTSAVVSLGGVAKDIQIVVQDLVPAE